MKIKNEERYVLGGRYYRVFKSEETEKAYQSIISVYNFQLDCGKKSNEFYIAVNNDIFTVLQWHELCKVCSKDIIYIPEIHKCVKRDFTVEKIFVYIRCRNMRFIVQFKEQDE